jgi:hypothetical protein
MVDEKLKDIDDHMPHFYTVGHGRKRSPPKTQMSRLQGPNTSAETSSLRELSGETLGLSQPTSANHFHDMRISPLTVTEQGGSRRASFDVERSPVDVDLSFSASSINQNFIVVNTKTVNVSSKQSVTFGNPNLSQLNPELSQLNPKL